MTLMLALWCPYLGPLHLSTSSGFLFNNKLMFLFCRVSLILTPLFFGPGRDNVPKAPSFPSRVNSQAFFYGIQISGLTHKTRTFLFSPPFARFCHLPRPPHISCSFWNITFPRFVWLLMGGKWSLPKKSYFLSPPIPFRTSAPSYSRYSSPWISERLYLRVAIKGTIWLVSAFPTPLYWKACFSLTVFVLIFH